MEKHTMLALSTSHITEDTAGRMDKNDIEGVVLYQKKDFGWFVYVPYAFDFKELEDGDCPADIFRCMKFALENGCDWIMFDNDVNEIPDLPVYDW